MTDLSHLSLREFHNTVRTIRFAVSRLEDSLLAVIAAKQSSVGLTVEGRRLSDLPHEQELALRDIAASGPATSAELALMELHARVGEMPTYQGKAAAQIAKLPVDREEAVDD